MNKAISVSKITKSFPGVLANSDINLEINEGTIHAIVGENGAGMGWGIPARDLPKS